MTGVNLVTTIPKTRRRHEPSANANVLLDGARAVTNLLIVAAFRYFSTAIPPCWTLDRYLGFHFFTNSGGGNMMMFINSSSGPVDNQ